MYVYLYHKAVPSFYNFIMKMSSFILIACKKKW